MKNTMQKQELETSRSRELVLHIGMPKTGTTTLQKLLFENHSGIYFLGKKYQLPYGRNCRSELVYQLLNPLLWEHSQVPDLEVAKRFFEELERNGDSEKVIVGSWESLCSSAISFHIESLRRIIAIFGACKIMICLRSPNQLIASRYLQSLRGRQSLKNRRIMGRNWYLDIDQWMEKWHASGSFQRFLSYGQRIRDSIDLLGKENVAVYLFEDLCQDQNHFTQSVCKFLGVDEQEGVRWMNEGHLHTRLTQGQVDFLKRIQSSFWTRWWANRQSPEKQREMIEQHGSEGVPAKAELPKHWLPKIADATRDGNRWLVDNLQLPLEKYNYPL
jgi:hypothetical protein